MDPEFLKGSKFEESIPPFEFWAELEEHNAPYQMILLVFPGHYFR